MFNAAVSTKQTRSIRLGLAWKWSKTSNTVDRSTALRTLARESLLMPSAAHFINYTQLENPQRPSVCLSVCKGHTCWNGPVFTTARNSFQLGTFCFPHYSKLAKSEIILIKLSFGNLLQIIIMIIRVVWLVVFYFLSGLVIKWHKRTVWSKGFAEGKFTFQWSTYDTLKYKLKLKRLL